MTCVYTPVLILSLIVLIRSDVISKYVECINVSGDNPSSIDPKSVATCPSTHILTSCGSAPIKIGNNNDDIFGTVIQDGNQCIAWTDYGAWLLDGIRSYARCCKLTDYTSSFIETHYSAISGTNDDDQVSISCPQPNEKLIGCTGISSNSQAFDGAITGNGTLIYTTNTFNTCNARNGNGGSGVYAIARCYDTTLINDGYNLECIAVWGQESSSTSTVSCPSDDSNYFMTSCSGYSPWNLVGEYMIENDVCTVTHRASTYYSVANAVCCRLTKPTDNPTYDPTTDPTIDPTLMPTILTMHPSSNPTIEPTLNPTNVPTIKPTFNPTYIPTSNPTDNPSINPTINPTVTPTSKPTKTPTPYPTVKQIHVVIPNPSPTASPISSTYDTTLINTNINNIPNTSQQLISGSNTVNPYELITTISIIFAILLFCICSIWIIRFLKQKRKYRAAVDNHIVATNVSKHQQQKQVMLQMTKIETNSNILAINSMDHDIIGENEDDDTGTIPMSIKDTNSGNTGNTANTLQNDDEFIVDDDDDIDIITPGTIENEDKYLTNGGSLELDGDEVITGSDDEETDEGTNESVNDDINDDIDNDDDDDIMLSYKETAGHFQQEIQDKAIGNELLMDDIINDIDTTPQ